MEFHRALSDAVGTEPVDQLRCVDALQRAGVRADQVPIPHAQQPLPPLHAGIYLCLRRAGRLGLAALPRRAEVGGAGLGVVCCLLCRDEPLPETGSAEDGLICTSNQ